MKVKMLVSTGIPGGYAKAGDVVDVDEETAGRWLDHKIAVFVTSETEEVQKPVILEKTKVEPDEVKKPAVPKEKKKRK